VSQVLALDMAGVPSRWLLIEGAITYYARQMVAWSIGDKIATYRGGTSRATGRRSEITTKSIIAIKGASQYFGNQGKVPCLSNQALFSRDRFICAYCGIKYDNQHLSRDHVVPIQLGGKDEWTNVVTSCRACNTKKGGRTPQQSRTPLIYLPYIPNRYEHLIFQNRTILRDQMDYLMAKVPKHSRLRQ
tara:strand:+ start:164 stop:727 length:564 start_codon:yes stop_codon:yes gene_type:complete